MQVNPFGGLRFDKLTIDEHLGRRGGSSTVAALQRIAALDEEMKKRQMSVTCSENSG